MKIAYLITIYDNPKHINRLIHALQAKDVAFFIHIDKKSNYIFNLPKGKNIYLLENNLVIYWGGFNFIEGVLLLIKKAVKIDNYDYYVLLSGSDYPVRSNKEIHAFFEKNHGKEFINISKMPNNNKPFHRLDYFYLQTDINYSLKSIIKRGINRFIRGSNIKRKLPSKYSDMIFYGGSTWWALSRSCISYILDFVQKNPEFLKFYRNTLIPEEMFFHTIIGNSSFREKVCYSLSYTDWSIENSAHPQLLSTKHFQKLEKKEAYSTYAKRVVPFLFARKFNDESIELLEKIDNELRID